MRFIPEFALDCAQRNFKKFCVYYQVAEVVTINLAGIDQAEFSKLLSDLHDKAADAVDAAVSAQDIAADAIKSKQNIIIHILTIRFIKCTVYKL